MEKLIKEIETRRQAFITLFKRTKIVNTVVLTLIIAAMAATFIWLFKVDMNTSLIVILGLMVILFAYSRFAKTWLNKKTYHYIYDYYRVTSAYFFAADNGFDAVEIKESDGIALEEFKKTGVLKDEVGIISRNLVIGKMVSIPFYVADAGVRVEREKKVAVAFFGKILTLELPETIEGHFIVYRRQGNNALPAGFDAFKALEETADYMVFGTEDKTPALLRKSVLKLLTKLELNELLADVTMVVKDNHVYLLLSYADAVMNVAYDHEADSKALERYEADLRIIKDIAKELAH